jgi:hypothetical protein
MSYDAATQVNVESLYFFQLDKRTRREREGGCPSLLQLFLSTSI